MRFASKRAEPENTTEAGSSKLMVGLVDKRKPGMEFLGKRSDIHIQYLVTRGII